MFDSDTKEPIPVVTIRVEGTGHAMASNDDGQFRLLLDPGQYCIKFSHVSHYSETVDIVVTDTAVAMDVSLRPAIIELKGTTVYNRAYDPAQEIIVRAIAHKEELLRKIRDYWFDAYTKLVVRKIESEDSTRVYLIVESQLAGYWEQPGRYKEIITARRQTANMTAEQNLISVGEIFNLNSNRLDFGRQQVVSPTADDALDYYNYYLLDTILLDGKPVFKLEIEPRGNTHPLLVGEILIADSTYDVVGVEVGFSNGFDAPYISDLTYRQTYAAFDDNLWMPIEVRFSGRFDIPGPIIPALAFDYVAALHRFTINEGIPDGIFDQYVLEVAETADDIDSVAWNEGQLVPLTAEETAGYAHIDSLENLPPSVKEIITKALIAPYFTLATQYNFVHFNRVDGAYLGLALPIEDLIPRVKLHLQSGYAFESEYWQHRYAADYMFWEQMQTLIGAEYHNQIRRRPLAGNPGYNPTIPALFQKIDPSDYYQEEGFEVYLQTRLLPKVNLKLEYHDVDQYSIGNATDYSLIWAKDKEHRPNPGILNGKLRSVSASLRWDSRPLMKIKGKESKGFALPLTIFEIGGESSWPKFIDSDFKFHRGYIRLRHIRTLPGLGLFRFSTYAGMSNRFLPPQRYFTMDFGDIDNKQLTDFKTQGTVNFAGDRVLSVYAAHDFGSILFRRLKLPLLKKTPFSLFVYGGSFWCDFQDESIILEGEHPVTAVRPYSEIGFGFGRLPPLFLRTFFTWQLSDYNTNDFSFKIGMAF
ncbi:MAG: DUF5686 and carboxypeptidase regulatory-like domain-containing protein [candidate division Zixibacteria bacterium]|nr:DUF5686 and carboxypeptidase regulatory-like domain-containing protein [candidate division Zixibacteria bacterium]